MSSPDLSVVMSVYNNADTLPAALDSVLVQTGVTFE
jgi:glycosyltransferase involved in cell wall biosynthesis